VGRTSPSMSALPTWETGYLDWDSYLVDWSPMPKVTVYIRADDFRELQGKLPGAVDPPDWVRAVVAKNVREILHPPGSGKTEFALNEIVEQIKTQPDLSEDEPIEVPPVTREIKKACGFRNPMVPSEKCGKPEGHTGFHSWSSR
jgi:hypothetical protein